MADPNAAPVAHVALMLTRRCPMRCGHCSVESQPGLALGPSESDLLDSLRQMAAAGVESILLTGGEPMIRPLVVLSLLREARRLGLATVMTSNGSWGRTAADAERHLTALRAAGLERLTLSYDRYHAEFQGPDPIVHIARVAERMSFDISVAVTRMADDGELDSLLAPFRALPNVRFRFYDVQAVGAARRLDAAAMRQQLDGFCNACSFPALTDDGRLTACNGPAYFAPAHSPLSVGPISEGFAELARRHRQDVILETIRTQGPSALQRELRAAMPDFPFKSHYGGMCDLCTHITSDPEAVRLLRSRLTGQDREAERAALRMLTEHARREGTLSFAFINGMGSRRAILRCIQGAPPERVLRRQDLDWQRLLQTVLDCGLAGPLWEGHPGWRELAPSFFRTAVEQTALRASLRRLTMRAALEEVAAALAELGARGILLKGGVALARGDAHARDTGDLDVWVPHDAERLHRKLRVSGWEQMGDSYPHHLTALVRGKTVLEIHTRLMHPCWRLPEEAMLSAAEPLEPAPLAALSPEGQLLHVLVHCSKHQYAFGLKTAFDVSQLLRADLDWALLDRWTRPLPAASLALLRVLAEDLEWKEVPLPPSRWPRLERVIRSRLYTFNPSPHGENPLLRTGLYWMMQKDWAGRLGCLLRLPGGDAPGLGGAARRMRGVPWRRYREYVMEAWAALRRVLGQPEFRVTTGADRSRQSPAPSATPD